jgi:flagellar basal-body rod protein FlgC
MDIKDAFSISAAGMKVQAERMRVIAQNVANADSYAEVPGGDPYRRKVITFKSLLDRRSGLESVAVKDIRPDRSEFERRYDPKHPAADAEGYVLAPNVNTLVEVMDMREAQRSYEANLNVIEVSKSMLQRTLDILR